MNEVDKIHLGRQAFTISVAAHKDLRKYLDDIKKQVEDKDVVGEVEIRMAELLSERNISGDKVVLPEDVEFLKDQLGQPKDFIEEGSEPETTITKPSDGKRLFRDTDNAMLAGVASGLSNYLGLNVLLIRILFVIGIFTGGWGILIYLVLWLVVPEAKTSSDRLQMVGKPVTVDGLKEVVGRADVKGAARRANNSLAGPINAAFNFILKLVGLIFIITGLSSLFGLVAAETYILMHNHNLLQDNIFPVGFREHLLLNIAMVVGGIMALFIILFGMAIFKRKWPIHAWITGILVGLVFIGLAIGGALTADAVPNIRNRYNANTHTTVRYMQPFTKVNTGDNGVEIDYQPSDKYSVDLKYYDHPDLSLIKTTVQNGTLTIDSSRFNWHRSCQTICIPDTYNMIVTVYSPNLPQMPNLDIPPSPDPNNIYNNQP